MIACIAAVMLCGCSSGGANEGAKSPAQREGHSSEINQWLAAQAVELPAAVYKVAPPDELLITAPKVKEIDGQKVTIRADGNVSLNLIGELPVNDLTTAEISERIIQKLSKFYKQDAIDVAVSVSKFKSRSYYVMGQVVTPGIKPYTGSDTILKVLAEARLNDKAYPQKIVIVRPNEDVNVRQRVTVDVKEMYENGKTNQNFLIEAGDVVYVPPSPLAEAAMTFQKLLFPVIPATNVGMMVFGL